MAAILRWFEFQGSRQRVYFRGLDQDGPRQLVVCGPGGQYTAEGPFPQRLEDFTEEELVELARRAFGGRGGPNPDSGVRRNVADDVPVGRPAHDEV